MVTNTSHRRDPRGNEDRRPHVRTLGAAVSDTFFSDPPQDSIRAHITRTLHPERVNDGVVTPETELPLLAFRYELADRSRNDEEGSQYFAELTATQDAPAPPRPPVIDTDALKKTLGELGKKLLGGGKKEDIDKAGGIIEQLTGPKRDLLNADMLANYVARLREGARAYHESRKGERIRRFNENKNAYEPAVFDDQDIARHLRIFDDQWTAAQQALRGESLKPGTINMEAPERQLLWAAVLAHRHRDAAKPGSGQEGSPPDFNHDPLVEAIKRSRFVEHSMETFAKYGRNLMPPPGNKDKVMVRWGKPGSWFYCTMPTERDRSRLINIDLVMAMIGGGARRAEEEGLLPLNHVRANWHVVGYHEIGHAVMSHIFPDRMRAAIDEQEQSRKAIQARLRQIPKKDGKRDHDEVEGMRADVRRFVLAGMRAQQYQPVWNAAEDIAVDRYAVSLTDSLTLENSTQRRAGAVEQQHVPPTQLDSARNVSKAVLSGTGKALITASNPHVFPVSHDPASPEARLRDLGYVINMSFYRDTPLREGGSMKFFPDDDRTWKALGVHPELIQGRDPAVDTREALMELCQQIEEVYPRDEKGAVAMRMRDPIELQRYLDRLLKDKRAGNTTAVEANPLTIANRERNKIIDQILERYVEPQVERMQQEHQEEIEQEVDQILQQIEHGAEAQGPGEPGDPQSGPGTPGMGGDEGDDKEGGQNIGDVAKGYDEAENEAPDGESPQAAKPKNNALPKAQNIPGRNAPASGSQRGNMPSAGDALKQVKFGDGARLRDILASHSGEEAVDAIAGKLEQLAKNSFVIEERLREEGTEAEFHGGDPMEVIDHDKMNEWAQSGGTTLPNFFRETQEVKIPIAPDFVFLLDGSPSMTTPVRSGDSDAPVDEEDEKKKMGQSRLTIAAQAVGLFQKSVERCNEHFAVHGINHEKRYRLAAAMWGDDSHWLDEHDGDQHRTLTGDHAGRDAKTKYDKYIILDPGNPAHTGEHALQRIERIEKGLNTGGTIMSPALGNMADLLGRQPPAKDSVKRGYTHFIVVSDGGVGDYPRLKEKIIHMMQQRPTSTVSVVLTGDLAPGEDQLEHLLMKDIMKEVQYGEERLTVVKARTLQEMPVKLYELMEELVERTRRAPNKEPDAAYTQAWATLGKELLGPDNHTNADDFQSHKAHLGARRTQP